MVMGTVNKTSSGSPARAADRSRTAIRSVTKAAMPIPPAASRTSPRSCGSSATGGAYWRVSENPVPARAHSCLMESGVGMMTHEWRASNSRFRYSSRPAAPMARLTRTGSVRSRLSAPQAATVITAPAPA